MKILVVEDERVSQLKLKRVLQKSGYEVTCANDGRQALKAMEKNDFSIVITDWMMPEMDGLELVRAIRADKSPDYTYIIMLTSKAETADLVAGMEAGADDFLSKPYKSAELRVRVRSGERLISLNQTLATVNARMRKDLESAALIQKSLLPNKKTHRQNVEIEWRFRPCDELAGDIFNFFELDEDTIALYLLDVSGHGVAAALLSVTLSRMLSPVIDDTSLLKSKTSIAPYYRLTPPAEVARQLNKRFLIDENNEQFFTIIYGILNLKTNVLTYISAGHPGIAYQNHSGKVDFLEMPSMPVGFTDQAVYEEQQILLKPSDRIYLYSDGILEARNPDEELYGKDRLQHLLEKSRKASLTDSVETILTEISDFTKDAGFEDDVSVLALELKGSES